MRVGYCTIKEADDLLKYSLAKGKWKTTPSYPKLSGLIKKSNSSADLEGDANTLFMSQLAVGDWIILDEYLLQVVSITDDQHLTVSEPVTTSADGPAEKLTSVEAGEYSELLTEKITYLSNAYDCILYSRFYSIPTELSDQEYYILQKAQAYLAAFTLSNPTPNRHLRNQNNGIVSESIGDTSVDYINSGKQDGMNDMPQDVRNILNIFEHKNRTVKLHRNGMVQNTVDVYYPRGPEWNY